MCIQVNKMQKTTEVLPNNVDVVAFMQIQRILARLGMDLSYSLSLSSYCVMVAHEKRGIFVVQICPDSIMQGDGSVWQIYDLVIEKASLQPVYESFSSAYRVSSPTPYGNLVKYESLEEHGNLEEYKNSEDWNGISIREMPVSIAEQMLATARELGIRETAYIQHVEAVLITKKNQMMHESNTPAVNVSLHCIPQAFRECMTIH